MNESNLHQYQRRGVDHILENPFCGLMLDMGLGKTVTTLTAVNRLIFEELEIDKVLIVAPKRVAENVWTTELEKWEHLGDLKASVISGNEMQRKAALKAKAHVYAVGRDNVAWLCGLYGGQKLPFDMVIFDESSSFKNPKSQRFKAIKRVQASLSRVVILTGTPAPNGLIDLWSQIYLLDRGERLGRTIGEYRHRYFRPNQRNGAIVYNYKINEGSEEQIYKAVGDICLSMKATDYLDMPDKIDNVVDVKLSDKELKAYQDFERDLVLELEEEEISAVNAAALSNKLLQYANGAVYDEDRNVHEVHKAKLDALEELIEEAGGKPILLAWTFRHDRDRILKRFAKLNPVQLKDGEDIKNWNAGKIQLMLMHPASGGHGLNLQAGGNIIVWFGQTWSLELYQQLNARLYRQGQMSGKVIIHHLAASGTLDGDVLASLDSKDDTQEKLLKAIKSKIKKYAKIKN